MRNPPIQVVFGGHSPIAISISKLLAKRYPVVHVSRSHDSELEDAFKTSSNIQIALWDQWEEYATNPDAKKSFFEISNFSVKNLVFSHKYQPINDFDEAGLYVEVFFPIKLIQRLSSDGLFSTKSNIIFLSSPAANLLVQDQFLSYHITKASLNQVIRFFAHSLAPVTKVNGIAPGSYVLKERNRNYYDHNEKLKTYLREYLGIWEIPSVEQIATFVDFLVSEKNSVINGQIIDLSGGYLNLEPSQLLNLILYKLS